MPKNPFAHPDPFTKDIEKSKPKHSTSKQSVRRWFMRQQDDLWILAGCAWIVFGTWKAWPLATPFVIGAMCIVWGVLISLEGKK